MTRLVVDVSPMAINRTAMYFVVRDTARHLVEAGLADEIRAAGLHIPLAEFVANDYELVRPQRQRVARRIGALLANPSRTPVRARPDHAYVVFDPLYLLSVPKGAPTLAFVLDMTPLTRPEWHDDAVSKAYATAFAHLADPLVDVAAISHSTARDLWANLGIPPSETRCIHLYNRFPLQPRGEAVRDRSLLFVGSLETRKNVDGLAVAFAASGLATSGYQLRIVGAPAHGAERIRSVARQVPGVALLGRLDDAQLAHEYATCAAFAYPSRWEGFGLPALEALAMGIPVLLSDCSALPEVGGPHAVYVDPCDGRSIANGLVDVVKVAEADDSDAIASRVAWAARFSRENYFAQLSEAVESLLSRPVSPVRRPRTDQLSPAGVAAVLSTPSSRPGGRQRRRILARRIMPATLGGVPGDSFSLDYLHCLQQEGRVELSRRVAAFRRGSLLAYPWYGLRFLVALLRLEMRNVVIRSMINETVSRKLDERLGSD